MKKRLTVQVLIGAVLVLLAFGLTHRLLREAEMTSRPLTEKDAEQIQHGMTLPEVEAILGRGGERTPPDHVPWRSDPPGSEQWFWIDGDLTIRVLFNTKTGRCEGWQTSTLLPPGTPFGPPSTEW